MRVIYKIKRFTRAEREAWKEFYKRTYNPSNWTNSLPFTKNTRDVLRFNKLANDLRNLSRGDKKGFDRENAKILLSNAGMSKLSGQVDHMIEKYTNKRALVRLARLKNRNINYGTNPDKTKINSILSKIYNRGTSQINLANNVSDNFQNSIKRNPKVHHELIKESHKLGVPVQYRTPIFYAEGYRDGLENYGGMFQRGTLDPRKYRPRAAIVLGTKANDPILAHEIGHVRSELSPVPIKKSELPIPNFRVGQWNDLNYTSLRGKEFLKDSNEILRGISDKVSTLADENSANMYGTALFKKVRKKKLGSLDNREMQPLLFYNRMSYHGRTMEDIAESFYNRNRKYFQ